ncbi:tripartite tricarboxylate transporter substrate binding protein [Roseomonas terrae]|uniref:Tripartite tricarboxylate transporter substrate binding protein n=1 Tax=Neoroseomonas terrae TaxID=424799 RepID=A0ABS5EL19_9PROT|nr:tripartite tricarboxylate transporter substrate binding protein [Neoroseomonas terrae]MBR0651723.1 tripartite tricarboxylate transporter substrate binding protein [Neoroseomonas terrae]
MMLSRRTIIAGTAAAALSRPALAQGWPTRQLRLIVPFPPAGGTDILARIMAERLGARVGQAIVIDNRPGAAGNIGAELAARAEPDGHTLFFASLGTAAINPSLYRNSAVRPEDLAPVALFGDLPNVVTANPRAPWKTLPELIAAAKAAPGKLTYGSSGSGSSLHLTGELLKLRAGMDLLHVPFRGGAAMLTELVAGRIDMCAGNLPTAIALIREGALRPLAVTSLERSPAVPDVPTVSEAAIPGFEAVAWFGVQVPARTPPDLIRRINAEVNATAADPVTQARMLDQGAVARTGTPEDFADYIRRETASWAEVIRAAGATVD